MNTPSYSITIATFVYRFDQYFKPLMNNLCATRPDVDKVVFVNGQHQKDFDQNYRKEIMRFCSLCPRTYLIMSPFFRGCSFMWNNCLNFTSTDYALVLNDDIMPGNGFFDDYENMLRINRSNGDESFRINYSFSHFCVYKNDLFDVGYFDERFLGVGEEDGDWLWRWEVAKKKQMRCYMTRNLVNYIDQSSNNQENIKKHSGGKYSAFNRNLMLEKIYEFPETPDPTRPVHIGLFDRPAQKRIGGETPNLYPIEKWYRENIKSI
jgi:hypothetical protein